jgi:RNA polymerase sigma-70 factor (ECF subfamily)
MGWQELVGHHYTVPTVCALALLHSASSYPSTTCGQTVIVLDGKEIALLQSEARPRMRALHSSFIPSKIPNKPPSGIPPRGRSRTASSHNSTPTSHGQALLAQGIRKDWKLVQQAVAGDSRAREELFATHATRLYRTAFSVLRNKEDAEDAVQNSLCSAFLNLRSFKGRSSFSTWLTRIVINSALMIRRRRGAHAEASLDEMAEIQPEQLRLRIVYMGPTPEDECAANQSHELVSLQVCQLPPAIRAAFQLHALEGLSAAETCQALGIGNAALKARIFRARHKLAGALRATMRLPRNHPREGRPNDPNGHILKLQHAVSPLDGQQYKYKDCPPWTSRRSTMS